MTNDVTLMSSSEGRHYDSVSCGLSVMTRQDGKASGQGWACFLLRKLREIETMMREGSFQAGQVISCLLYHEALDSLNGSLVIQTCLTLALQSLLGRPLILKVFI